MENQSLSIWISSIAFQSEENSVLHIDTPLS